MPQRHGSARTIRWLSVLVMLLLTAVPKIAGGASTAERTLPISGSLKIDAVRVEIDAPPERRAALVQMARQLIGIAPGATVSADAVTASIEALRLSNRFAAVHVDSATTPRGETLIYTLVPNRRVSEIRIHGNYPIFESVILNQMTLYPGDPFTAADLPAQSAAIAARLKRAGYIDPQVSVESLPVGDDGSAAIRVEIHKGPHYVLGTLRFDGNRALSAAALKWHMGVWRAALLPGIGRFSEAQLKTDVENLLQYYRGKGFADARLSYRIAAPDNGRQVDATIDIREGDRYVVEFEGNRHFWDLTLKKDVVLASEGNLGNIGVRRSMRNIRQRYRNAGFLETRVTVESTADTAAAEPIRRLRIVIDEGPRTLVDSVAVNGNRALPDARIRDQMLTRPPSLLHDGAFVPETLEEDTFAVTTLYMQEGFQERTVDSAVAFTPDRTGADVALNIDEGPRTRVRSIAIEGLTAVPQTEVRAALALAVGDPFRQPALDADREAIASLVSEKGYPHVAVTADTAFNRDHTRADIVYTVDPGPRVILGGIYIAGNLRTHENVIRRELAVTPDKPLSLRALYDGQRRLRDLAIFHGVTFRTVGLKEKGDTVYLFVDVEERKPYYAQTSVGYESDSGLFGRIKVGDHNLLGLDKDLWAGVEVSETGYRVESRLTEPHFLGSDVTASVGAYHETLTEFNQPFGTRTTGASLTFGREWGPDWTTNLGFRLEKRDQFSVESRDPGAAEEETRTLFVTTPSVRYDSRDSFVRPTRGLLSSLSVDISQGIQNRLDDFVRYQFDTRYYRTPVDRLTLAGLARVGQVVSTAGSGDVPDDQLFYLGGIQDVRGYKENLLRVDAEGNPVGGKTAMVGSLEARIDLGMNFELATFFDIGRVQDSPTGGGTDRFRSSVGFGLRYITPIGPMGLLYGHKLDRQDGESAGRLHLSVGYSF